MLIQKPRDQLTAANIREICHRFDEGLRVEYKRELNKDVKESLPAVVSSFANSYGGLLIIGVNAKNGKAVEPIEGFDKPAREELPLTVENLCHGNIYPLLMPLTTEVKSDIPGKVFLVVEVESSPGAPHAIENSRKVYVRVGSGRKLYDLADLDLIERLIRRRDSVLALRKEFEASAEDLVEKFLPKTSYPKVRIIAGPRFPHTQIVSREKLYQFLRDTLYRGGAPYTRAGLKRLPEGVCGIRGDSKLGYLDTLGHLFHTEIVECNAAGERPWYRLVEIILPILQALIVLYRLYKDIVHASDLLIEVKLVEAVDHVCVWGDHPLYSAESFKPIVRIVPAEHLAASENLESEIVEILTDLTYQILWPMKEGDESLTEAQVRGRVSTIVSANRPF